MEIYIDFEFITGVYSNLKEKTKEYNFFEQNKRILLGYTLINWNDESNEVIRINDFKDIDFEHDALEVSLKENQDKFIKNLENDIEQIIIQNDQEIIFYSNDKRNDKNFWNEKIVPVCKIKYKEWKDIKTTKKDNTSCFKKFRDFLKAKQLESKGWFQKDSAIINIIGMFQMLKKDPNFNKDLLDDEVKEVWDYFNDKNNDFKKDIQEYMVNELNWILNSHNNKVK